ncbi:hypothetical protein SADUNF_Sadunf06G0002200 [Salix dunnii]|uniref:Uncharacterized protein n=1 Tax=Salix dunnii TaxID=1413687 RepID=A0A835K086_9ROSI|nr:hypothetical protein SADUNF_Sadunf06G0002200 [Salix dunnii]
MVMSRKGKDEKCTESLLLRTSVRMLYHKDFSFQNFIYSFHILCKQAKMVRNDTVLVAFTCLLVVASIAVCANATAAPRLLAAEQVVAAACLSERYQTSAVLEHAAVALKERIVASQHNKTMRCGCGSM